MSRSDLQSVLDDYDGDVEELVEDLLWEYFTADDEDMAVVGISVRRRRLERKLDSLKASKERIKEDINDVEAELRVLDGIMDELNEELFGPALENCASLDADRRVASNDAIQKQAEKVGLSPQRFIEKLNERFPTDRFGNSQHS